MYKTHYLLYIFLISIFCFISCISQPDYRNEDVGLDIQDRVDVAFIKDMVISEDMVLSEDMILSEDMVLAEDILLTEDEDMTLIEDMMIIPGCTPSYERCDGEDNDCDGDIDEAHWEEEDITPGLALTFSTDSNLGDALLLLTINPNGHSELRTLNQSQLADLTIELEGAVEVELEVIANQSDWQYQITAVHDLSEEMRLLPPPYPQGNSVDLESFSTQVIYLSNNLSEGIACPNTCPILTSQCINRSAYCPDLEPVSETCNNSDDDCDGLIDENLMMKCSADERGGMRGLCGEIDSICEAGEWSSCSFEQLNNRMDPLGVLINEDESCDCYDNDCDGVIDEPTILNDLGEPLWSSNSCSPDLSRFTTPPSLHTHCHFYPLFNYRGESIRHYQDLSGVYYIDELTVHSGAELHISRPEVLEGPGFSQEIDSGCLERRDVVIGGNFTLIAQEINIESNAEMSASSFMGSCDLGSSQPNYQAYAGMSGGNLWLLANTINIDGKLSANGSSPSNIDPSFDNYHWYAGGAAGSIKLIASDLNLNNALIETQGGRGACQESNVYNNLRGVLCDNSSYAGGGPGSYGGQPFPGLDAGGSGSGGPLYDEIDSTRNLQILGQLSSTSTVQIKPQDGTESIIGNGSCDGYLHLSAGTLGLFNDVVCAGLKPNTFTYHQATFLPLDNNGRPIFSKEMYLEIYSLIAEEDMSPPLVRGEALNGLNVLTAPVTFNAPLRPGEFYRLKLIDEDDEIDVSSVLYLAQIIGLPAQGLMLTFDENNEVIFQLPGN